jgi:hypothetical protein
MIDREQVFELKAQFFIEVTPQHDQLLADSHIQYHNAASLSKSNMFPD